jgi:hypothetical protein
MVCEVSFNAEVCELVEVDGDLHVYRLVEVEATVRRYDDGRCIREDWSFEDADGESVDIDFDALSRTEQFRLENLAERQ